MTSSIPPNASIVIVGEQPGNDDGLEGHPFHGPSGRELERVMGAVGLDRDDVFVTNAVKRAELAHPLVIVCLGQTAASSVFGHAVTLRESMDRVHTGFDLAGAVLVTFHPSAILRSVDRSEAMRMENHIVGTLEQAKRLAASMDRPLGAPEMTHAPQL